MLGVDAEAEVECASLVARVREALVAEAVPLREGVEVEMSGDFEKLGQIFVRVGGRVSEGVFLEFLVRELGFPKA